MAVELNANERRLEENRREMEARRQLLDRRIDEVDEDPHLRDAKTRRKHNDRRNLERRDD